MVARIVTSSLLVQCSKGTSFSLFLIYPFLLSLKAACRLVNRVCASIEVYGASDGVLWVLTFVMSRLHCVSCVPARNHNAAVCEALRRAEENVVERATPFLDRSQRLKVRSSAAGLGGRISILKLDTN